MIRSMTRSTLENKVNYRSLLAGNTAFSPIPPSDYDLLETTILTGTTSSVTFSSLNSTYGTDYKHLQVRITARSTRAANPVDVITVQFNNDSSSTYRNHVLGGSGSAVNSSSQTATGAARAVRIDTNNSTTGAYGAGVIDFLDAFDSSKNTVYRSLNGHVAGATDIELASGSNFVAAALDVITFDLLTAGEDFVAGSRFSLYGIKAA